MGPERCSGWWENLEPHVWKTHSCFCLSLGGEHYTAERRSSWNHHPCPLQSLPTLRCWGLSLSAMSACSLYTQKCEPHYCVLVCLVQASACVQVRTRTEATCRYAPVCRLSSAPGSQPTHKVLSSEDHPSSCHQRRRLRTPL